MSGAARPRGRPKGSGAGGGTAPMQALDRALSVLTAVARGGRSSLTDLAHGVGVPTATTHRILTTLEKRGFVAFDPDAQLWSVGIEAYRTGAAYLSRTSLIDVGRPLLQRLMDETGETANLAVADGASVVVVAQVEARNPVRACFAHGARTPMHASGTGKAILAALPEAQAARLLAGAGLTRFTERTLAEPEALVGDLRRTRARGWSFEAGERHAGMSCVGAAVWDESARPVAGVSISGPSARFSPDHLPGLGAAVAQTATEITSGIGGRPPEDAG
ncbi:IclR family transcriptional regulator [Rhodobacteraceae bacterium CCMM004]|nr:IclR family transcriptional regulator [Rhodobacteraceae bacterium CCMM004]